MQDLVYREHFLLKYWGYNVNWARNRPRSIGTNTKFKNNFIKSDPKVNVAADIVYKSSPELLKIIDTVKNMDFVPYVEWSEITEVVDDQLTYLLDWGDAKTKFR